MLPGNAPPEAAETRRAAAAGYGATQVDSEATKVYNPVPLPDPAHSASATQLFSDLDRTAAASVDKPKARVEKPASTKPAESWQRARRELSALGARGLEALRPMSAKAAARIKSLDKINFRSRNVQWILLGAIVLVIGLISIKYGTFKEHGPNGSGTAQTSADVEVRVTTVPADAQVEVAGVAQHGKTLRLKQHQTYAVTVSRTGFKAVTLQGLWPTKSGWNFTLQPEPLHIHVFTAEASGKVLLDGRKIADLEQGELSDFEFPSDGARHMLSASNQTNELFRVAFQSTAGSRATVEPLTTKDLVVTSSLGRQTT